MTPTPPIRSSSPLTWTAFAGSCRIASGSPSHVAAATKKALDEGEQGSVLVFNDTTCEVEEIHFQGTVEEVVARVAGRDASSDAPGADDAVTRGPGRPKLGVVAREVTLLPRHWEWLGSQPGGASVALRKLVEEARRRSETPDRIRKAKEALHRFLTDMAGDLPGYEEALRTLYAGDSAGMEHHMATWPADIRDYARELLPRIPDPHPAEKERAP